MSYNAYSCLENSLGICSKCCNSMNIFRTELILIAIVQQSIMLQSLYYMGHILCYEYIFRVL